MTQMTTANALFHALKKLEPNAREQIEAVADAIGCPEWTGHAASTTERIGTATTTGLSAGRNHCLCRAAAAACDGVGRDTWIAPVTMQPRA